MELHILFFILAGLLIALLVGFSFWSARREKSRVFSNAFSTRPPATPINTNVVSDVPASLNPQAYQASPAPQTAPVDELDVEAENPAPFQQEVESSLRDIKISLPGQETPAPSAQATPVYGNPTAAPQPVAQPQPTVQLQSAPVSSAAPSFAQEMPPQPVVQPQVVTPPQPTSVLEQSVEELERQASQDENVDIYSDASVRVELAKNSRQADETPAPVAAEVETDVPAVEDEMIMLYVVAPEGQQFRGEFVVQSLEALGFQYGEYQIFHRHQHLGNSASPVIFSVANMMQPGIFDMNKIDRFSTVGLVLFMHLPSEGNDAVNFKLLLKTTENLARTLGGFILNDRRELFDEASRQAYLDRVS